MVREDERGAGRSHDHVLEILAQTSRRFLLPNLIRRGRRRSLRRRFRCCGCRFLLRRRFGQFVIYFGSFDWMNAVIVGVRLGQLALPLQQGVEAFPRT